MPEHIDPNETVAHTPFELAAGEEIELAADVVVLESAPGETALAGVQEWFGRHGVSEPNPLPHGDDLADEVEFSMAAYLRSLWNEEEEKWHPSFFGPASGRTPRWIPSFLYDLRVGMELSDDAPMTGELRRRYERVVELSGIAPVADDMGFHFAGPAAHVLGESDAAGGLMASQREDGSWRFRSRAAITGSSGPTTPRRSAPARVMPGACCASPA